MLEATQWKNNAFVTLTYNENEVPLVKNGTIPSLKLEDVQLWLKRLRRQIEPITIRYFMVGEYGDDTWRPHYHAALFNFGCCAYGGVGYDGTECPCDQCSLVRDTWGKGHVMVGSLEAGRAEYLCGYTVKKLTRIGDERLEGRYPEFARMSLKPGIGATAMEDVSAVDSEYGLWRNSDVPGYLNHDRVGRPIGRYLRGRLRVISGKVVRPKGLGAYRKKYDRQLEMNESDVKVQALRLDSIATKRASVRELILEKNEGKFRNFEARREIWKQRKTL